MKKVLGLLILAMAFSFVLFSPCKALAATLSEAKLTEDSRGYGGNGNQDKNRTEETVTVRVSVGGGDSDWETGDFSNYYVYENKNGDVMDQYEMSFGDIDSDGDIDMTDLFNKLDEYKADGTCDFSYTTSDFGDFYMDVFGISTGGSLTYKLNNIFCQAGTPDLYDGDSVVILLMTGESNMWSDIDDSGYEHVVASNDFNAVATNWFKANNSSTEDGKTDSKTDDKSDDDNISGNKTDNKNSYSKYINMMKDNLIGSFKEDTSLSDGNCFWQEMRILRNNDASDEVYVEKLPYFKKNYHETKVAEAESGKLKAVNAMRDASVTGDNQMLDYLAHGYNGKDAATWDKQAGMYAVDYILMCLDNEKYAMDEEMAANLSDCAESESVRDDLIKYIVDTDGCWGGGWFTYDTGAQNAQAIIPYYSKYPEVKNRVDDFFKAAMEKFRADESTPSAFDASSSSEVSRALCLMYKETGDDSYAKDAIELYNMVLDMGLENTKFKGNAMDVWRMALNEWGLNSLAIDDEEGELTIDDGFRFEYDTATLGSKFTAHLVSNIEMNDLSLYELVLMIPEGLSVTNVTSPVAGNIEYNVEGDLLRIVATNLGDKLAITSAADVLAIDFKSKVTDTVSCKVVSSIGYVDSENKRNIKVTVGSVGLVAPCEVEAEVLYEGSASSRFIDKDSKVWRVIVGGIITADNSVVLSAGGKIYDLYESTDLTSDSASVYFAYLPSTIEKSQLTDIDNYEVVKDSKKKSVIVGDVDDNKEIDVKDALHVIRMWVGKEPLDEVKKLISSNVNKDDDVTNADTLAIVENKVNGKKFKVLK